MVDVVDEFVVEGLVSFVTGLLLFAFFLDSKIL